MAAPSQKRFTIYTSTSNSKKVLKNATQIVLTVTPHNQGDLFINQTPIAWKVLSFQPRSDTVSKLTWNSDAGFSVVGQGEQIIHVPLGSSGVLESGNGGVEWTSVPGATRGRLMARNESEIPQTFTLGSIDDNDEFSAFLQFPPTPHGGAISVEPAVMLQAYAITGRQEGQPLSQVDSKSPIFHKWNGVPDPIDLTTLADGKTFLLSSQPSGKITLE